MSRRAPRRRTGGWCGIFASSRALRLAPQHLGRDTEARPPAGPASRGAVRPEMGPSHPSRSHRRRDVLRSVQGLGHRAAPRRRAQAAAPGRRPRCSQARARGSAADGARPPPARRPGLRRRNARRPRRPLDGARPRRVARADLKERGPFGAPRGGARRPRLCAALAAVHGARPPPSRHQGAERHARGGRPHRADGLRHRRGARRAPTAWSARRFTSRRRSSTASTPRSRATSTASACCCSTW